MNLFRDSSHNQQSQLLLGVSPEAISRKKAALEGTYSLLRWETELLKPRHKDRLPFAP